MSPEVVTMADKKPAKVNVSSIRQYLGNHRGLDAPPGLQEKACGEMLLDKFSLDVLDQIERLRQAGVPFEEAIKEVRRELAAKERHDLPEVQVERSLRQIQKGFLEELNSQMLQLRVELGELKDRIEELIALVRHDA